MLRWRFLGAAALVLTACSSSSPTAAEHLRCQVITEWESAAGSLSSLVDIPLGGAATDLYLVGADGVEVEVEFDGQSLSLEVRSTDGGEPSGLLKVRYNDVTDVVGPLDDVGVEVYDSGPRVHPTRQLLFEVGCRTA